MKRRRPTIVATEKPRRMGPCFRRDDVDRARQRRGNELCLRFENHKPSAFEGQSKRERVMLRFKIWASAAPLIIAALLAGGRLLPANHPCIALANNSVEIADLPWHADLHVAFTADPAAATVRVQLTESAEAADFAIVDGAETPESGACEAGPAAHAVAISSDPARGMPVIYLSGKGPADYRVFVRSKTFSAREAAALVVGS